MTAFALTQRRRTGTALIAVGAMLLTLSAVMMVGLAPGADAEEHCIPAWPGLNPATNNGNNTISGNVGGVDFNVSIIHNAQNESFTWQVNIPVGGSVEGQYVQQGTTYPFSGNSGAVTPPSANAAVNHVQICAASAAGGDTTTTTFGDTTTTTLDDGTTTTVAGPDEPDDTTTTVAGPDDPELPDTGPGELLALLAGGLGLTFVGSGSLVIAGDRRRAL